MPSDNYQEFIIGEGETVVDGKSHWKNFIQVSVADHNDAFTLAMDILRQIEHQRYREKKSPVSFSLTGTLKSEVE